MKLWHPLLFVLLLASCKQNTPPLTKITANTLPLDSSVIAAGNIDSIILPYKKQLTAVMDSVLAYTPKDLVRTDGDMQSSLGNLMADLCYAVGNPIFTKMTGETDIDFAMLNHGGIRNGIPEGAVTTEHAFALMPFENELVVATISGEKVGELVDFFLENKRAHPLSKHIELRIKKEGYALEINGQAWNPDKTYKVLTSDYLQTGGDNMTFFKDPKALVKLDMKVRDAILTHFRAVDTLKTALDKRVIVEK